MKFKDVLNYGNTVYKIGEQMEKLKRKNPKAKISAFTASKLLLTGIMCQNRSINEIMETTYVSENFKNIYDSKEVQAKTHGLRDCIIDTDYSQYREINKNMIKKLRENKFFRTNLIDGLSVVAVDGVEEFETNKKIEGLPEREHKDGRISGYYKTLGIMSVGEKAQILLGLEELQAKEEKEIVEKIKEETKDKKISESRMKEKIKAEGELTVFKRIIPELQDITDNHCDVATVDSLYGNSPIFNLLKENGINVTARFRDERRDIYKDAMGLFEHRKADMQYEEVEIEEIIKTTYNKNSHRKNKIQHKIRKIQREITNTPIGKKNILETKKTSTNKYRRQTIITEKVIKRVQVWSDLFDMKNYKYRKNKVC